MKFFARFKKAPAAEGSVTYCVDGMSCNHCKASVEQAAMTVRGVSHAEANVASHTLTIEGTAHESAIRQAVEKAGFTFKGTR